MKTEDPKARVLRRIFYGVFRRIQKSLFYIGVAYTTDMILDVFTRSEKLGELLF